MSQRGQQRLPLYAARARILADVGEAWDPRRWVTPSPPNKAYEDLFAEGLLEERLAPGHRNGQGPVMVRRREAAR